MRKYILAISTFFLSVTAFGMAGAAQMATSTFIVNSGDTATGSGANTNDTVALDMARQVCQAMAASDATGASASVAPAAATQTPSGHTNGDKLSPGNALCASEMDSLSLLSGQGRPGDYVCQCM